MVSMNTFPDDVLRAQAALWRLPEVWGNVLLTPRGSDCVVAHDVAAAVLRDLATPMDGSSALLHLLREGEYAALGAALADDGVRDAVGDRVVSDIRRRLRDKVAAVYAAMEVDAVDLRARNARLSRPLDLVEKCAAEAELLAPENWKSANAALVRGRTLLASAEENEAAHLENARLARFGPSPTGSDIERSAAVASALRRKEYDLARFLLSPELDDAPILSHGVVVPIRSVWDRRYPPAEILSWFDGRGSRRPPHFEQRWGIQKDDVIGIELLEAVRPFVRGHADLGVEDFRRLAQALNAAFGTGQVATPPQSVHYHAGAWWYRFDGFRGLGIPALAGPEYARGVVFAYAPPQDPSIEGTSTPGSLQALGAGGQERHLEPESHDPEVAGLYYIHVGAPPQGWSVGQALQITWHEIMAVAGDPNRTFQLTRYVARRVHPRDAFPIHVSLPDRETVVRPDAVAAIFNDADAALWIGPARSGKTALLFAAEDEARRRGWRVVKITKAEEAEDIATDLSRWTSRGLGVEDWLIDQGADGVLYSADDIERFEPRHAAILMSLLQALRNAVPQRIAVVCTANHRILSATQIPGWRRLGPLTLGTTCARLLRLLEQVGVSYADRQVIDRLALFSSGHPAIAHLLLHHLGRAYRHRRDYSNWIISSDVVERVFASTAFRDDARGCLLDLVETEPLPLATLAAILHRVQNPRPKVASMAFTAADVAEVLREEQATISTHADTASFERALAQLECAYLVSRDHRGWNLARGGIGRILREMDANTLLIQAEALSR